MRDGVARGTFFLDSPAAPNRVRALEDGEYEVAMGEPEFAPARIPLAGFDAPSDAYGLELDGRVLQVGAVSMGNPHAVV